MKIWNHVAGEPWTITEPSLRTILSIATRKNENIEAISARLGEKLENTYQVEVRDGVAIIPVNGPLFRYANLFTMISGATSYELLARDFTAALENPEIHSIMLDIDSPGGEVNGCSEFANMIYEARGTKPIIAYASGDAASGAYWIASACEEIYVSETSGLGSIGVVAVYTKEVDENIEETEIVSSQSPYKRLDPSNDENRTRLQKRIDDLASVFVESVAKHRGIGPPKVLSDYGQGDVMIGKIAVENGLADKVSTYEKTLQELIDKSPDPNSSTNESPVNEPGFLISDPVEKEQAMSKPDSENQSTTTTTKTDPPTATIDYSTLDAATIKSECPDIANFFIEEGKTEGIDTGVKQERERVGSIIGCDEAKGRESLAQHLAFKTDMSAEVAKTTLSASPKLEPKTESASETSSSHGFEQVMADIDNPEIETSEPEGTTDSEKSVAQRIASFSSKKGEIK